MISTSDKFTSSFFFNSLYFQFWFFFPFCIFFLARAKSNSSFFFYIQKLNFFLTFLSTSIFDARELRSRIIFDHYNVLFTSAKRRLIDRSRKITISLHWMWRKKNWATFSLLSTPIKLIASSDSLRFFLPERVCRIVNEKIETN